MATSKTEQVLKAIEGLLESVPGAKVERNTVVPERVPKPAPAEAGGGLVVLRDGDPGEPEQALGGFGFAYYSHAVEVEVYVEEGDAAARDATFDALVQGIGAALDADPSLSGLAFGMTYGRPEIDTEAVAGAPAIKTGTITVTVEYETASPLG